MTTTDVTLILSIGSFLLVVLGLIGGYVALRSSITKTAIEIQEKIIGALHAENELLQDRIDRLEQENKRMNDLMQTVISIFEKRGVVVEIVGELVQVKDRDGSIYSTVKPAPKRGAKPKEPPDV
jgi:uncharacterized protein (UPF0335 family)